MQARKSRHPFTHPKGLKQQDHSPTNAHILIDLHARQKWNEKKALDLVKKKTKLKWDELQAQTQQMPQVRQPLLVCLAFKKLLGIIRILARGVGFISQSAWAHLKGMKTLLKQFGQANLLM